MNIKKDFYPFSFIKLFILLFFIIHFSLTIDRIESCNTNQYYNLINYTCLNCPENSTRVNSNLTCNCTNPIEYFNSSTASCSSCENDFGSNFGLNFERNTCINCTEIVGNNDNVENYKCKCGNSRVLFYDNNGTYKCMNDSLNNTEYPSVNPSKSNLYETDSGDYCIGIGYYYNTSTSQCVCNKTNYDLVTYKVNSNFSFKVCIPNITKIDSTRRMQTTTELQFFDIAGNPVQNPINYEYFLSVYQNDINVYKTICSSLSKYRDFNSCNALANYCVLTLYTRCDDFRAIWDSAENIEANEEDI